MTQTRSHNLANEITQIDSTSVVHDDRGNLTDDGSKLYEWNIANQLVAVREKATNNLLGQYAFDSFGRRIWKKVIATGEEVDCFLTGNRVIEERRHTPSTAVTYNFVWGQYIDELVCRYTTGTDYYPVQNRQYSTHRVFDGAGALVEKYRYRPHGQVEFFDPAGTPRTSSVIRMTTLFTGSELDPESGLYYFRARMWSPQAGRFMQRDPLSYVDGMNLYNGYFVPEGMDPWGKFPEGTHPTPGHTGTPNPGHTDMPHSDIFDQTAYDYGWTSPYNPLWGLYRHFRDFDSIQEDIQKAYEKCDLKNFSGFLHQGEDYFSHRLGYGNMAQAIAHHISEGSAPDDTSDPAVNARFQWAAEWAGAWMDAFLDHCCKYNGKWMPRAKVEADGNCCDKE